MDSLMVFSSDDHAGALAETYREYLETRFHQDYDAWVKSRDEMQAALTNATAKSQGATSVRSEMLDEERRRFGSDLPFRLERLEKDGIVGEVLYPDSTISGPGIPFAGGFGGGSTYSAEQRAAGFHAHNRWQAENLDPSRQVGLLCVGYDDIDAAAKEIHWGRSVGMGGVLLDGINPDYPPLHDEYFDPLWAACTDEAMPVHFHTGNGGIGGNRSVGPRSDGTHEAFGIGAGPDTILRLLEFPFFAHRPFWFMINGGVFDRHPGLKIVFAEQGTLWAVRVLKQNDWMWENLQNTSRVTKRRPSEYSEHVYYGASNPFPPVEIEARYETGLKQIMWGSDHPHFGSPWDCTTEWLRVSFGACKVPEREVRMMLGENAAHLYGLDLAKLNAIAERVGPKVPDVLREPDLSDFDHAAIKVMLERPERAT